MNDLLAQFWFPSADELRRITPELALAGTIVAVLVAALFAGRNPFTAAAVALIGLIVTLLATASVGRGLGAFGAAGLSPDAGQPMLLADGLSVFFKLFLVLFLALVIGLWLIGLRAAGPAARRSATAIHAPEFLTLLLGSALGMVLMVGTLNLLMIVLAIELASLPSYAVAGFHKRERRSAEASLKYVIFGAVTAAIMLYGVSLLYGYAGSLDLGRIAQVAAERAGEPAGGRLMLGIGLFGLCVGIGFKIAAVPFHFWCPDVFEGAPIEVTTWLSVSSKAAALGLIARIVATLSGAAGAGAEAVWGPLAAGIGVFASLTCTVGNFAAYRQDNVKRILAYSSIAHAGYMLMAAAILLPASGSAPAGWVNPAVSALIVYVLTYLFMNLGAFAVTAMVAWQTGSESLAAFADLGRRAPWLAVPMAVCLFSLVGLPPLGGFLTKWWLLVALGGGAARQPWLWAMVIVLVLNTLFSLYFYVRIIVVMFLGGGATRDERPAFVAPRGGVVMVNACAAILLVLGTIGARPLKLVADDYASRLFRPVVAAAEPSNADAPVPAADTAETLADATAASR